MKKSTQYLYDCEPSDFAHKPYVEALNIKVAKAEVLMAKLANKSRGIRTYEEQVEMMEHYQAVEKAKEHNEMLLMEMD